MYMHGGEKILHFKVKIFILKKAVGKFKVKLPCVRASRIGPLGSRVIPARLLRFRLGADKSPAPSAQSLQPDRSDARPIGRLRRNPIRAALAFGAGVPGGVVAGGVNAPRRCGRLSPVQTLVVPATPSLHQTGERHILCNRLGN
jgi:hypothetical protein